jgi:ABC-2 type transport system ATP-binding protein
MRAGRFLAEDSPDGLRRRTGAPDVETAFLRLIDAAGQRTEASA